MTRPLEMLSANMSEMAAGDSGTTSMPITAATTIGAAKRATRLLWPAAAGISAAIAAMDDRRRRIKYMLRVVGRHRKHHSPCEREDRNEANCLWHEGYRGLSNLRRGLKHCTGHPEHEAHQQRRTGQRQKRHDSSGDVPIGYGHDFAAGRRATISVTRMPYRRASVATTSPRAIVRPLIRISSGSPTGRSRLSTSPCCSALMEPSRNDSRPSSTVISTERLSMSSDGTAGPSSPSASSVKEASCITIGSLPPTTIGLRIRSILLLVASGSGRRRRALRHQQRKAVRS